MSTMTTLPRRASSEIGLPSWIDLTESLKGNSASSESASRAAVRASARPSSAGGSASAARSVLRIAAHSGLSCRLSRSLSCSRCARSRKPSLTDRARASSPAIFYTLLVMLLAVLVWYLVRAVKLILLRLISGPSTAPDEAPESSRA